MSKFNIAEARIRFSELVRQAMHGEEVIIARDDSMPRRRDSKAAFDVRARFVSCAFRRSDGSSNTAALME